MRKLLLIHLSMILVFSLKAQDIHFSHIHATPMLLNPAMTGMFDGDLRLLADFKSQWKSVGTDYRTMYAAVDLKTRTIFGTNSGFGVGLEVYSDKAGDLAFRNYGALLNVSGMQTLDGYNGKKMISVAGKIGFLGQSVDFSKIYSFENDPLVNDVNNNTLSLDISLGLGWFHEMKHSGHMYYLGVSANHINRPRVDFGLDMTGYTHDELHRKFIIHAGADFKMTKKNYLQPSLIFMDQGPHREITIGTFWKYSTGKTKIQREKKPAFSFGAWARWYSEFDGTNGIDAVIGSFKMNMNNTAITLSYDVNISSLAVATQGRGGPEISLIQTTEWRKGNRRRVHCPSLNW